MTTKLARPSVEATRALEALEGAVQDLKAELMKADGADLDEALARAQSATRWLTQVRNHIAAMVPLS